MKKLLCSVLVFIGFFTSGVTFAKTQVICYEGRNDCNFILEGLITLETLEKFESFKKRGKKIGVLMVVSSEGGDIHAAMSIGRLLRKDAASIYAGRCASACVFLVAGAVWRDGIFDDVIIIHRPFSTRTYTSYADAKSSINMLNIEIETYLKDMNISPALLTAMNSIPSYSARQLTKTDMETYGLVEKDPVWEEKILGQRASQLGIDRPELHRRIHLMKQQCDPIPFIKYDEKSACIRAIGM